MSAYSVASFERDLERQLNPHGIRVSVSTNDAQGTLVETWRLDRRYARTKFTVPARRLSPIVALLVARSIRGYYARQPRRRT